MKILPLTLYRKWFDEIAIGKKTEEYRAITPYWEKRFLDNGEPVIFDEIHFKNGYNRGRPWMRVEWKGLVVRPIETTPIYIIQLGRVLEIKNWPGPA
jgi:hypothetical protein